MIQQSTIHITRSDLNRLGSMIETLRNQGNQADLPYVRQLEDGLEFAEVVESWEVPPDVVTMRSEVKLRDLDTEEESTYSIVFPAEANIEEGKISILTPLASALLGYKRGDTVEFKAPTRVRRLHIVDILYQPEAVGVYDI